MSEFLVPPIAVLTASGTNRQWETTGVLNSFSKEQASAVVAERLLYAAGGKAEIVHMADLIAGSKDMRDYAGIVLPGGFSYGENFEPIAQR